MLSLRQLDQNIDSLKKIEDSFSKRVRREINASFKYSNLPDSAWKKAVPSKKTVKEFKDLIPDSARQSVYNQAASLAGTLKNTYQFTGADWENKKTETKYSNIEWHRKFSFSLACLVLFFIGAPLGSIIRKGGLGMPLVVAIIFFIIFHLLNIFGEKFAKENVTSIFFGMWLAIFVLIPIGIFLTYKAMHDSQLFNKEFYNRFYKKVKVLLKPVVNRVSKTE